MDIVTKSHFDEFMNTYGYNSICESDAFELFSIYSIASKYCKSETISKSLLEDIKVGNGGDWGIDGFLIVVNGKIVTNTKLVDDLLSANGSIDAQIVIIQSKTSTSFSAAELGMALDGIENLLRDVLGETELPSCNSDLQDYRDLLKHIYSKSSDFSEGNNPILHGYYVCCGTYNAQKDFESKVKKTTDFVESTDLVRNFSFSFLDKKEIVNYYKSTKTKPEAIINIEQKITLPKVEGIADAYLCILPYNELQKLYISDGRIMQEVFYDNVRAFQGLNLINRSISDSLKAGNIDLFAAMNNGITVIARKLQPTGHDIRLVDYQIVNGCQTCNVLFINKDLPDIDKLKVTVKLIASEDKGIRDKIIIGNNSQTEVKREQLISLLETQKLIEDYYNAQNTYEKLYYERRSKQYKSSDAKVPQNKIVTIPNQIISFVSMIMEAPDKVRGYYGSIVEEFEKNGNMVFSPETNPALYYTCALASYKMQELFSCGFIDRKYRKVKFHVLLAFRLMCQCTSLPAFNSNKVQHYCDHLCSILCDTDRCKEGFNAAIELVNAALNHCDPNDSDRMKESFTKKMKELAAKADQINKRH